MKDQYLSEFLSRFRGTTRYIWQLVAVAVVLALAINLLASVIYIQLGTYPSLALGLALGAACLGYLVYARLRDNVYSTVVRGFFMVKDDFCTLVNVPGYSLATGFYGIGNAAFGENAALERQWRTELHERFDPDESRPGHEMNDMRVATEIAEYILLEALSTHLTDYFDAPSIEESQLETLERNDIPDVLLSNRILELISRELQDRPWYKPDDDSSPGRIVLISPAETIAAVFGPKGQYSHFELTMPKGSTVRRTSPGSLVINSKMVTLELTASITWNYGTPMSFERYYLNKPDDASLEAIEVTYAIKAAVRRRLGFRAADWNYYSWVESFIDSIKEDLDGEAFFRRISWDSVGTLLGIIFDRYPPGVQYAPPNDQKLEGKDSTEDSDHNRPIGD
jgi:hypothetical protein